MAIMDNWNQVKKFQSAWLDGDVFGSAEKENERFINSAEGKIIKLKESLKQLVTDTISTDMFKTSLDGLSGITGVLNGITKAADKMQMSLPLALGTLSSLFMTIKSLGTNKNVPNLWKEGFSAFDNKRTSVRFDDYQKATRFVNQYTKAISKNTESSNKNAKSNSVVTKIMTSQQGKISKITATTSNLARVRNREIKVIKDLKKLMKNIIKHYMSLLKI